MELYGKKINFIGDSITRGFGVSDPAKVFPAVIKEKYRLAEARNYGVSGTRIARQKTPSEDPSADRDFCLRIGDMDPDADIVFILGGVNDFAHGDAPLGTFADRTPGTFYGALHYLYRHLMEKYPEGRIVAATPMHIEGEEFCDGICHQKSRRIGCLKDYVRIIREVAEYYSLPLLDLYACSGIRPDIPAVRERYMADGAHPNDAGHALLADRIGNFLSHP